MILRSVMNENTLSLLSGRIGRYDVAESSISPVIFRAHGEEDGVCVNDVPAGNFENVFPGGNITPSEY